MKTSPKMERPRLRPQFYPVPLAEDRAQLRSAHRSVLITGAGTTALIERVLPLLDGTRTIDEVVRDSGFASAVVEDALNVLEQRQLLEDASAVALAAVVLPDDVRTDFRDQLLLFSTLLSNPYDTQVRLLEARVAVIGNTGATSAVADQLRQAGVGKVSIIAVTSGAATESGSRGTADNSGPTDHPVDALQVSLFERDVLKIIAAEHDLLIVCNEGPARTIFLAINDVALDAGVSWLPITLFGNDLALGPLVIPRQTACFACYEARMSSNLAFSNEYVMFQEYLARHTEERRQGGLRPYRAMAAALASIEVIKFFTKITYPTAVGRLLRLNLLNYQFNVQSVLRLPRCPSCGNHEPVCKEWEG